MFILYKHYRITFYMIYISKINLKNPQLYITWLQYDAEISRKPVKKMHFIMLNVIKRTFRKPLAQFTLV